MQEEEGKFHVRAYTFYYTNIKCQVDLQFMAVLSFSFKCHHKIRVT